MPALEVDDLTITYGSTRAVTGLSFSAGAGEVLALLGPNGAGKTSTVEALEGYRRPTSGAVRVLGFDPVRDKRRVAPRIGVMLQAGGVHPGIRPLEALRLHAALYPRAEDPEELLDRVGLTHLRRSTWRQLSGGEQQRLSLALALVGQPEVAFLDEPSAGVDVAGRQLIRQIVRDLSQRGTCVLLTTHDLDEAEKVADRIVIIDHGHLVTSGTPAELMTSTGIDEIRFGAPAGLDVATLGKSLMAAVEELAPGEYRIDTPPTPANVAALTAWLAERDLPLADLRAGRHRLEDVFLKLTAITGEVPAIRVDGPDDDGSRRRRSGAA
ncbi:MAG: transporter [Acidimicrobiales bacterium]|nr:transporter [Acidimicrobiales bacterium]